jgi:ketosteroid isomerase-like protein
LHGRTCAVSGKSNVRARFRTELDSIPDIRFELLSLHGSADHVVFRSRVTGTLDGRSVTLDAIDLLTLHDGLVRSKHTYLVSPS